MGLFDRLGERASSSAAPAAPSAPEPGSVEAIAAGNVTLLQFLRRESGRIPNRAYILARTIAQHLDDVVADPSAHLLDVGSRITLERVATTHLPDTINAYLAARTMPNADELLVEQLATLEVAASKAAARSIEAARDAFLIQGSFLEDKYGSFHV